MKNNRFKLNIQLFALGADGSMAYQETMGDSVDNSLQNVVATYAYLTNMNSNIGATVSSLSSLPSVDGVAANGEYANAIKCLSNSGGSAGIGGTLESAITRTTNVMRAIMYQEGASEEQFQDFLRTLNEGSVTDSFGQDLENLDKEIDFVKDILYALISGIPQINMGTYNVTPIVTGLSGAFLAYLAEKAKNPDLTIEEYFSDNKKRLWATAGKSVFNILAANLDIWEKIPVFGPAVEIVADAVTTTLPNALGGEGAGEAFLKGTAFSVVQNGLEKFVGKATSTYVATQASNLCTKPFVGSDGEVSQGWCAAAGAATLAGAAVGATATVVGAAVLGAATIGATAAAAVAIGPALAVGAAVGLVGYGLVAGAKALTNWWKGRRGDG